MRKIYVIIPALILMVTGCSAYSVKKEINEITSVKGAKKLGIVVRTTLKSRVTRDEVLSSISRTLNGYKHETALEFLSELTPQMTDFAADDDRFYQSMGDKEFLKYKSIGVLKTYLRTNADEIKKTLEKNGLDGIVFYEEYAVISLEMQLMRMTTVIAVTDKEGNIAYLDHQDNMFNSSETDIAALKKEMVLRLDQRFVEKMKDFGFIKGL